MLIKTDLQQLYYASNLHCPHFLHSGLTLVVWANTGRSFAYFDENTSGVSVFLLMWVSPATVSNTTHPSYSTEPNCRLASQKHFRILWKIKFITSFANSPTLSLTNPQRILLCIYSRSHSGRDQLVALLPCLQT